MKIIALDWGQTRIGVAIGDTANQIPFPRDFIISDGGAIDRVISLVQAENAEKIILGLPRKLDGSEGDSAQKVQDFAEQLRANLDCEIELVDERFSTVVAQKIIHSADLSKSKRQDSLRNEVDSLAALELLRNYFAK